MQPTWLCCKYVCFIDTRLRIDYFVLMGHRGDAQPELEAARNQTVYIHLGLKSFSQKGLYSNVGCFWL